MSSLLHGFFIGVGIIMALMFFSLLNTFLLIG